MAEESKAKTASAKGGDSNLFGALAYLMGLLSGILVYLLKKEDSFARFHAMQSILLSVGMFVLVVGLTILSVILGLIPVVGQILALVLGLVMLLIGPVFLVLWLLLMWKAYNGEKWKLPIIGPQAEKMSG